MSFSMPRHRALAGLGTYSEQGLSAHCCGVTETELLKETFEKEGRTVQSPIFRFLPL